MYLTSIISVILQYSRQKSQFFSIPLVVNAFSMTSPNLCVTFTLLKYTDIGRLFAAYTMGLSSFTFKQKAPKIYDMQCQTAR